MKENIDKNNLISISQSAKDAIIKICNENNKFNIRLAVIGGGCSGLSYKIDFSEAKDKDYRIKLTDRITILLDPKSSIYLKDSELIFQSGLNGKGFIFQNPNATNTCGCGESFAV